MGKRELNGGSPPDPAAPDPSLAEFQQGAQVHEAGDNPAPTVENQPGSLFQPGPGVSSLDISEVTMMLLMQIFGGPQVEPGALRSQLMRADRVAQLSPEAQRWMKIVN